MACVLAWTQDQSTQSVWLTRPSNQRCFSTLAPCCVLIVIESKSQFHRRKPFQNIMPEAQQTPFVFVSHSQADAAFADQFEKMLSAINVPSWNYNSAIKPGDNYLEKVQPALENCTHIVVLIGPLTKDSRWVDMEMEVAMSARESGPGAGLIGVILPNHDDFKRPYYEPESVPLRLHEFITRQVAILKKWPESPEAVQQWLEVGERRRHAFQRRTRVSLSTLKFIREHQWTDEGNQPREEALLKLSLQHAQKSAR